MNIQWNRKAHGLVWAIAATAAAGIGARVVWIHFWHGTVIALPITSTLVDGEHYGSLLERAGLGADVLAAAGVSAEQVGAIVSAASAEAAQQAATIASADASARSSRGDVSHLTRIVQAGAGTEQQMASLATARTALAAAESSRNTALAAIFNAGVGAMSESQGRIAAAIRGNRHWGLALHHLAASTQARSEADWVALRDAIACHCASERCGDEESSDATALIAASESVSDIAAAKTSLANNAGAVATAWNTAVAGG